ncbi:MAG: 2TM domain-containing protein [Proteobacteria bacterium]|nr:2TM domain-containing protein [Pseudomonadota bacterium]
MTTTRRTFTNQEDAVAYVKELSGFYKQVSLYVIVNIFFIVYWLLSGEDYFWPIWVILGWGTPLFFVAVDLQILPKSIQKTMNSILEALPLPFLKPEWETDQLNRLMRKKSVKTDNSSLVLTKKMAHKSVKKVKTVSASLADTAKVKPAKKTSAPKKKAAPKKAAAKKAAPKKASPKAPKK